MVRVLLPAPTPRKLAPAPPPDCSNGSGNLNSSGSGSSHSSGSSGDGSVSPTRRLEIKKERKRRGKFKTEQLRKETCMTRTTGACIRCQKNKIRCIPGPDPNGWCQNCLALSSRVQRMPCFRARVTEAELFRKGPTSDFAWTRRWILQTSIKEIDTWSSLVPKVIDVTQDLGVTLQLRCKEFIPLNGDRLDYTWTDVYTGARKELWTPPYAIADVEHAHKTIDRYIENNLGRYLEGYMDSENPIAFESFRIAASMASEPEGSKMIHLALKLWVGSRLIEQPWRICGHETLGMMVCLDEGSPYYGKIPVTPIMDFQIDNIAIHYLLVPWKSAILKELQKKILGNRKEDWLEIHLTMFILLNNVERQIKHDNWFARRYQMKQRFSNYQLINQIFWGANVLLAHFHHVNKGHMPFSLTWESNFSSADEGDELLSSSPVPQHQQHPNKNIVFNSSGVPTSNVSFANSNGNGSSSKSPVHHLSPDQLKYMQRVTKAAKQQEPKLRQLREHLRYEEPMYWCAQLFLPGWTNNPTPSPQDPWHDSPAFSYEMISPAGGPVAATQLPPTVTAPEQSGGGPVLGSPFQAAY